MPEAEEFVVSGLKFFPLAPILPTSPHLRQITDWLNLGNGLSENETEQEPCGTKFTIPSFKTRASSVLRPRRRL